jgi:hypothetical protein
MATLDDLDQDLDKESLISNLPNLSDRKATGTGELGPVL